MVTVTGQINYLSQAKNAIRSAIQAQGVEVQDDTPLMDYAGKIGSISGDGTSVPAPSDDGWVRPADRPPVPEVNENEIYMLFGVMPDAMNDYAISLSLSGGSWEADFGDGSAPVSSSSGFKIEYIYDYNSLNIEPNSEGIKWVWMKFYCTNPTANFTSILTNARHSKRPSANSTNLFIPQVYEIYINAPKVSTWLWGGSTYTLYGKLEILDWQGENSLSTFAYFLYRSVNLRRLNIDTRKGSSFASFLNGCSSFNQPLNIDTSLGTDFTYFLSGCSSFNHPVDLRIRANYANISIQSFLSGCRSLNKPVRITGGTVGTASNFMENCVSFNNSLFIEKMGFYSLQNFFLNNYSFEKFLSFVGAPINQIMSNTLPGCFNLKELEFDLDSYTNASLTFGDNWASMQKIKFRNMGLFPSTINLNKAGLTASGIGLIFEDLYDRSANTAGTITITSCAGASQLTPEQRAIATNKNWTIVG